jgi:hexosaminidase
MEKFINSKGKKIIGWDEILEGGLAPNATVMSWRGVKGGIEAAKAHHEVIMTPTDYAYFDFYQGDPSTEPLNIGGYLPLEKVYSFDPVPKDLSPDEAKYILGGQANIWTEYLQKPENVEYQAFPRMLALSEVVWSTPENKNFADFKNRLSSQLARLDKQNVNYRIPEPAGLANWILGADDKATVELTAPIPGSTIRYTIDGRTPDETSPAYTKPLELDVPAAGRVDVKTIVVLASGRKSSVYTATLIRRDMLPSVELADKRAGLTYGIVSWRSDGVPEPLVASGETKTLGLQQFSTFADTKKPFAVTFNGYFNAPADGMYEFEIASTYTAGLEIDGVKMIDDTGKGDRKTRTAVIPLKAGLHKIGLRYANSGGDPFFRVRWAFKGQQWRNLGGGTGELVH